MKHSGAKTACCACCTECRGLTVSLEGNTVLEGVSLHLHCGEMTAIIGPNGAGKTTLFKAILGQIPYKGEIRFTDAKGERIGMPRIGYVPQALLTDPLAPITVFDYLGASLSKGPAFLPPTRAKREKVFSALCATGAEELVDRRLGALSGGEAQRVMLALALSRTPDLLLLDEPVSGIDAEGLADFYRIVDALKRDYDVSILLISHDFSLVKRYADRVVLLSRRVIALGPPLEVLSGPAFASVFPGFSERGHA